MTDSRFEVCISLNTETERITCKCNRLIHFIYCHVPAGRGLHKTVMAPGCDKTWAVKPDTSGEPPTCLVKQSPAGFNLTTEGVQLGACYIHKVYVKLKLSIYRLINY